ncbi:efflux RND transporter periplasmic adaptor subunit [Sphingomonas mali]|uniref:efflux RND transporter periplasmic adaptor subunit n=1 Tax=Sphingomonas mali TaxID=40682 RepID=UPI0008327DDB|nr:efflux RND transporter periplasmic adaptor subunit [Sphingomonas mali]
MKAGLALTLAILLAACGAGEDAADGEAKPVALVALAPAQQGTVDETLTVYGAVEAGAMGKHVLAAPAEATVVAIEAPVGTKVGAGQVIVRLAPSPTSKLDYAKAATDAATAQAAYARAQRLRADGLVSDADVETARAAAQSASTTRASLGARNGALTLRAPTAGFVESVASAPGDLVAAGTAVASIAGSGNLRARFGLDPSQASRIRPGMVIRVTPPSGVPFSAPVLSVDPVVDPTTRLASLFINVPPGSGIGTNSALNGQLDLGSNGGGAALTIPYGALLDDAGQPFVFVVSKGVAHRRDVETGPVSGDRVVIVNGVKPGDQVVTEGGTALEDGMQVRTK